MNARAIIRAALKGTAAMLEAMATSQSDATTKAEIQIGAAFVRSVAAEIGDGAEGVGIAEQLRGVLARIPGTIEGAVADAQVEAAIAAADAT